MWCGAVRQVSDLPGLRVCVPVLVLQEMLLQSGDDGFESTTIVLFPAWPCSWDVNFKVCNRVSVDCSFICCCRARHALLVFCTVGLCARPGTWVW